MSLHIEGVLYRSPIGQEIDKALRSDREVYFYRDVFGLQDDRLLAGKCILDIGSGDSRFAREVNLNGLASVTQLDAKYFTRAPRGNTGNGVCAYAQALPFPSNTFDEVLASYSTYWMNDTEEGNSFSQALFEMLRVVKDNGSVKIHPTRLISNEPVISSYVSVHKPLYYANAPTLQIVKRSQENIDNIWSDVLKTIGKHFIVTKSSYIHHNLDRGYGLLV